jgi:hypothetical protein
MRPCRRVHWGTGRRVAPRRASRGVSEICRPRTTSREGERLGESSRLGVVDQALSFGTEHVRLADFAPPGQFAKPLVRRGIPQEQRQARRQSVIVQLAGGFFDKQESWRRQHRRIGREQRPREPDLLVVLILEELEERGNVPLAGLFPFREASSWHVTQLSSRNVLMRFDGSASAGPTKSERAATVATRISLRIAHHEVPHKRESPEGAPRTPAAVHSTMDGPNATSRSNFPKGTLDISKLRGASILKSRPSRCCIATSLIVGTSKEMLSMPQACARASRWSSMGGGLLALARRWAPDRSR